MTPLSCQEERSGDSQNMRNAPHSSQHPRRSTKRGGGGPTGRSGTAAKAAEPPRPPQTGDPEAAGDAARRGRDCERNAPRRTPAAATRPTKGSRPRGVRRRTAPNGGATRGAASGAEGAQTQGRYSPMFSIRGARVPGAAAPRNGTKRAAAAFAAVRCQLQSATVSVRCRTDRREPPHR